MMEYESFPSIEPEPVRRHMRHRCGGRGRCPVTVEPAMFLLALAVGFNAPTHQAVFYRKMCLNLFNQSVCNNLYSNESHEFLEITQKQTSKWENYANICFTIPALFAVALYGSWSDRFSRKIPLLLAPIGAMLNTLCFFVNAYFMDAHISYLLIGQFLDGLTGGYAAFLMAAFSYLSSASLADKRTKRISIVYASQTLSSAIAAFSSGVLLDNTSFIVVYSLVLTILLATILYLIFGIPEIDPRQVCTVVDVGGENYDGSKRTTQSVKTGSVYLKDLSFKNKIHALFSFDHMKESMIVTFKWRAGKKRQFVLILISIALLIQVSYAISVQYLYLRHPPLSWTQTLYGYYKGFNSVVHFTSQAICLPLLKDVLGIRDQVLLIAGIVSETLGRLWLGFCSITWMVFLTPFINYLMTFSFTCLRSLLSNLVSSDEFGKIFAVIAWLETLGSMAATMLYNGWLYPATVDVYPGLTFIFSGALMLVPLALALWFMISFEKTGSSQPLDDAGFAHRDGIATIQANELIDQIEQVQDTDTKI